MKSLPPVWMSAFINNLKFHFRDSRLRISYRTELHNEIEIVSGHENGYAQCTYLSNFCFESKWTPLASIGNVSHLDAWKNPIVCRALNLLTGKTNEIKWKKKFAEMSWNLTLYESHAKQSNTKRWTNSLNLVAFDRSRRRCRCAFANACIFE